VAAALSSNKSCFLSGFGSNQKNLSVAFSARESLIENGFGGKDWHGGTVKGDLIAVIAAYRAWKKHKSDSQKWKFCRNHAMDQTTLREMDRLRNQFRDLLVDAGFLARPGSSRGGQSPNGPATVDEACNRASEDALLTSCCLVAGMYPNICSLIRPRKGGPKGGRLYTNDGDESRPQPSSFQSKRLKQASETGKDAYAVYHSKHRSIGAVSSSGCAGGGQRQRPPEVFLTEINFVSRFALLLFGGDLEIVKNAIIVDGWLKFKVSGDGDKTSSKKGDAVDNAVLILALRETLDSMILEHVLKSSAASRDSEESPKKFSERHDDVIRVVRKLLSEEG
jgi:hypothetical protein